MDTKDNLLTGAQGPQDLSRGASDWGAGYVVAHNLVSRLLSAHKRWLDAPSDDSAFEEYNDLRNEVIQAVQKGPKFSERETNALRLAASLPQPHNLGGN